MELPNFDQEFDNALTEWRERHKLPENDAVLLLVELFRIHQRHWDEIRRREMPSFEQFRSDIAKLSESSNNLQQQAATLLGALQRHPPGQNSDGVTLTAAVLASFGSLLAGFLIARAW